MGKCKHILVASHSCATAVNQQLYHEIHKRTGWKFTIVVPKDWRDEFGNVLNEAAWPGMEEGLRRVPVLGNGNIILHVYRESWRSILREARPDVIYVNHEPYALATAQICLANRRAGNAAFGFYSCQNLNKKYPPPFRLLERMVYRSSSFALPITEEVSSVLRTKGFQGDIAVCALPLDPTLYHPDLPVPPHMAAAGDAPVIGFVGRAVEVKGLRTLAAALISLRDIPWRFVLVGTGDFMDTFKALLDAGGVGDRLMCPGYVPHQETPRWLAGMDILVLPSETQPNWKEQFGRVIPEALACGAAVVGSSSGEIPNLINKSGGGLVFPECDSHALAVAIRELLENPSRRADFAKQGRVWVLKNIAMPAVANRMIETFSKAAERHGNP